MRRRRWLLLVGLLAAGCAGDGGCFSMFRTENDVDNRRFAELRDRYFVRHLLYNPVTSTYLGGDGYSDVLQSANAALKDYSAASLARELAFYRDTQEALLAIPPERLRPPLQVDYRVVDAQLKFLIRLIGERRHHQRAVDTYTTEPFRGIDWHIQQMQNLGDGAIGTDEEWTLLASRVDAIPRYLETAKANLLEGKKADNLPDWRLVQRDGIGASRANADYFRQTLPATAATHVGARALGRAIAARLRESGGRAAAAWEDFARFLEATYDPADRTDRFAAGAEEYEWRVRTVFGDARSAAELYAYGADQVAHYSRLIQDAVAHIAKEAAIDADTRAVVDYLAQDSPSGDGELFAWYRDAAARAVAYGRERAMFDIPQDYRLDIVPTPPILRSTIEAAYYMAPPFKQSGIGRFYLTPAGNDPAGLRRHNRASIANTAIHEGFPGHDWHFKFMALHAADISNVRWLTPGAVEDSSSMWIDSLAAEGWGLYAEELMAEPSDGRPSGFYSAPEYLYVLQGQMMRAVRVRVDVGIHTGRMTFEEARDYYAEHVEFYPGACAATADDARAACDEADRAIYRYSKWPTQAIAYNLGKHAIVALREEYRKRQGADYSPRSFHEQFMKMGLVPVAFFRDRF